MFTKKTTLRSSQFKFSLVSFHFRCTIQEFALLSFLLKLLIYILSTDLEIIQMPQSQAVQEGKKLVLSCRTRGLPDVRYRWVKDDVEIPGANRSDLVLEPVRIQDFGRYFCRVWDKSGSVTSDTAEIDVYPAPQMSK